MTPSIPQTVLPHNKYIPEGSDYIHNRREPESETYYVSFQHYNDKVCEIKILEKNNARNLVKDLRTIGKCCSTNDLVSNGIRLSPIYDNGDYHKLFRGLTDDVDIKEHIISSEARLFYFIVRKTFYIVAITNNHLETNKHC